MNGKSVYRQLGVLVAVALVCLAALWWSGRPFRSTDSSSPDRPTLRVHVRAVAADDTLLDRSVALPDSATVEAAIKAAAEAANIPLGLREYDFGVLVVKIGAVAAGADGDWTYRVNDSLPPLGVRQCRLADGDRVDFHFGKNAADSVELVD